MQLQLHSKALEYLTGLLNLQPTYEPPGPSPW